MSMADESDPYWWQSTEDRERHEENQRLLYFHRRGTLTSSQELSANSAPSASSYYSESD